MGDYGRETIALLEIDQPFCQKEWGTTNAAGTCSAAFGANVNRKCYNTRATCPVPSDYLPATQVLRFARSQEGLMQYDNLLPSIRDNIEITAGAINLGGMDRNLSALGAREVVTLEADDHKWSDVLVDKYRTERITGAASLITSGNASAGSASTLTLEVEVSGLVGKLLRLIAGAGSVQERVVRGASGLIATVASPWAVNELQRSEELDNAYWSKSAIVVANAALGIDGTNSFETVEDDNGAAWETVSRSGLTRAAVGSPVWVAFHITKDSIPAGTRFGLVRLGFSGAALNSQYVDLRFDSSNGAILATPQGSGAIITGSGMEDLGSHWRFWISGYTADAGWTSCDIQLYPAVGAHATLGSYNNAITGKMGAGAFQFGQGATPTAYIKTVAAAVALPDATTDYEVRDAFNPQHRGSFWSKWKARNPYFTSYRARVRQGLVGQPIEEMRTTKYVIDKIAGPKNGKVTITLKDLFSLIEERKSVAPLASKGELSANINDVVTSATLNPAGIGNLEYAASGYVAIGDEICSFTRSGDVLTLVRGQLGTDPQTHDDDDLVQQLLVFTTQRAHDIIYTLLTVYSGITAAEIDKAAWDIQAASMPELYTAYIASPEAVKTLIGELCEQAGCTVWPNTETGMVEFRALRSQSPSVTVTDNEWIVDKSLDIKIQDAKRVSRVMVYYGQRNPLERLNERKNFHARVVVADLDAESSTQYGVPALKEFFSRWIPQFGRTPATAVGNRTLSIFRDPPVEASFRLYRDRDGQLQLAQSFLLETFEAQDDTGAPQSLQMVPVQISRDENEITVKAQELFFTTGDPTATRTIYLDSDALNLDLRAVHDGLYAPPTGVEVVRFVLVVGTKIGSTSTSTPAIRTGIWPTMATLPRLTVEGRLQGKGGAAGTGGNGFDGASVPVPGGNGTAGGPAFLAESDFEVDNLTGQIWGGGGGGGGGGGALQNGFNYGGGGSGGSGQGRNGGTQASAGLSASSAGDYNNGGVGGAGNSDTSGSGGTAGRWNSGVGNMYGGAGGAGGGAGLAGANGGVGNTFGFGLEAAAGTGGAAGAAVQGNSFITWINTGDRRGGIS
jgi:hypothetical protein